MSNISVTRVGELAQKKVKRVFAARVDSEFWIAAGIAKLGTGTKNLLLAHLPENAVVTDAYLVIDEAANSATAATVALGFTEAGAQLMAATDLKAAGVTGELVDKLATGSGKPLFAQIAYTGNTSNYGTYTIVVEYAEYTKNSGEYTRFEA